MKALISVTSIAAVAMGAALTFSAGSALAQDAAAGEKVFAKCKVCHQIGPEAKNSVGPVLTGVVGRPAGTYPGYNYSEANKGSGLTWDEATLQVYLKNPKAKVPGRPCSIRPMVVVTWDRMQLCVGMLSRLMT